MLDIYKIVGENIRKLRIARGWSGVYLAEKLDTTPQEISGIEAGNRGLSMRKIERLCDALGCIPYELFLPPHETNGDLIKRQLQAEIDIMCREDIATLCANAVALNAARGIKPE